MAIISLSIRYLSFLTWLIIPEVNSSLIMASEALYYGLFLSFSLAGWELSGLPL
jgi:hypothetical protein